MTRNERFRPQSIVSLIATILTFAACGGSQPAVTAERARVTACQVVEQEIEDSDASFQEKVDRIDCVRAVCDALHGELVESVDE